MNHKIFADYGRGDSGDWFEQKMGQKGEDLLHRKRIELRNPILVQRAFKKEFKAREAPGRKTILKWVNKFRSLGTIESLNTSFEVVQPPVEGLGSGQRRLLPLSKNQLKTAQNAVFVTELSVWA